MFSILGVEKNITVNNKKTNRIHISQDLPDNRGSKPFPISILNSGNVSELKTGDPISLALDLDSDNNVVVSKVYTSEDVTFVISGYEFIKSKDSQVFTKVYIYQQLPGDDGVIPLPLTFFVAGQNNTYVPGSPCDISFDIGRDGKLMISSLNLSNSEPDIVIS